MNKFSAVLFLIATTIFSGTFANAQGVNKDWGVFGSWRVDEVSQDQLWAKPACMAFTGTRDGLALLQFFAQGLTGQDPATTIYTEPTVQVIPPVNSDVVTATMSGDVDNEKFGLTLSTNSADPTRHGLMSRIDDRSKIVRLLKRANWIQVSLINAKGTETNRLSFAMNGSSAAITAAVADCKLVVP